MQPLISFIVPVYNVPEPMLRECIESILAVSLDSKEIIVVDDGSPTPVTIPSTLNPQLSTLTVIRQENQGLSGARNTGIAAAQGKFIQFVDSDDCLIAEAYNKVLSLLNMYDADIFLFKMTTMKDAAGQGSDPQVWGSADEWAHHNNIQAGAWGYLFRRSLLEAGLRFTPGIFHEDEEFTPLLFQMSHRICTTGQCAYFYRQRSGSITNNLEDSHLAKRLSDFLRVILELRDEGSRLDSYLLTRRAHQLTMDYAYNVHHLVKDSSLRKKYMRFITEQGLWPLPVRMYTWKYFLFSLMSHLL